MYNININDKKHELEELKFIDNYSTYNTFFKKKNIFFKINCIFFCLKKTNEKYESEFYNYIYEQFFNFFFLDKNEVKIKQEMFYLYLYIKNNFNTYRFFYGYPNNLQKTRSNYNSQQQKKKIFRNFLLKNIYYPFFKRIAKKTKINSIVFEFFNKYWFFFWQKEWYNAKENFKDNQFKKHFKYKYAEQFTLNNKAVLHTKIKVVKKNKKKVNIPNNIFNIGFEFCFYFNNKIFKK